MTRVEDDLVTWVMSIGQNVDYELYEYCSSIGPILFEYCTNIVVMLFKNCKINGT